MLTCCHVGRAEMIICRLRNRKRLTASDSRNEMGQSAYVTLLRVGRPTTIEKTLVIFSIAITLLMVDDRPLAAAAVTVTPSEFRQIAQD